MTRVLLESRRVRPGGQPSDRPSPFSGVVSAYRGPAISYVPGWKVLWSGLPPGPRMDPPPVPVSSPFPELGTRRLVLREITLDDAEFWKRNFSDPDVVQLTAYEPPRDLEAAKTEILQFAIRP